MSMSDKIRKGIEESMRRQDIKEQKMLLSPCSEVADVGDEFVLSIPIDMTISWLVVRRHPDDKNCVLIVPITDFPLAGVYDVKGDYPNIAHPKFSEWIHVDNLPLANRVAWSLSDLVQDCRKILHQLAIGLIVAETPAQESVENDPYYVEHCQLVEKACEHTRKLDQRGP